MDPDQRVNEYIEQFSPEFQKMIFHLRNLVFQIVPEATEAIKWNALTFSFHKKPICYVAGFTHHVTFAFHNGTMLRDPGGILMGSGKFLRYIKYISADEIDTEQVSIWILEGFYT